MFPFPPFCPPLDFCMWDCIGIIRILGYRHSNIFCIVCLINWITRSHVWDARFIFIGKYLFPQRAREKIFKIVAPDFFLLLELEILSKKNPNRTENWKKRKMKKNEIFFGIHLTSSADWHNWQRWIEAKKKIKMHCENSFSLFFWQIFVIYFRWIWKPVIL